jgi:hypothetical protein
VVVEVVLDTAGHAVRTPHSALSASLEGLSELGPTVVGVVLRLIELEPDGVDALHALAGDLRDTADDSAAGEEVHLERSVRHS